jgi:hypothetical protein
LRFWEWVRDMCTIPVDLERRFERQWAARFVSPVASTAPKSVDLKGTVTDLPRLQEPMKLLGPSELEGPVANLSSGLFALPQHDMGCESSRA